MRYGAGRKEATHQRVLGVTAKAIRRGGVRSVSVAGVMSRAGLTHGGFYGHFRSKDALLGEAMDLMIDQVLAQYLRLTSGLQAEDALRAYVDHYLSPRHRDGAMLACPHPVIAAEVRHLGEAPRMRFDQGLTALVHELTKHLRQLGFADPEDLAWSVMNEMIGAMSLASALADRERSNALLERARRGIHGRLGLEDRDSREPLAQPANDVRIEVG